MTLMSQPWSQPHLFAIWSSTLYVKTSAIYHSSQYCDAVAFERSPTAACSSSKELLERPLALLQKKAVADALSDFFNFCY